MCVQFDSNLACVIPFAILVRTGKTLPKFSLEVMGACRRRHKKLTTSTFQRLYHISYLFGIFLRRKFSVSRYPPAICGAQFLVCAPQGSRWMEHLRRVHLFCSSPSVYAKMRTLPLLTCKAQLKVLSLTACSAVVVLHAPSAGAASFIEVLSWIHSLQVRCLLMGETA